MCKHKREANILPLIARMISLAKKERKKEGERFMAAFVCEVVLDLAQHVWAELHFANYFLVAEFSAWHSSHSEKRGSAVSA